MRKEILCSLTLVAVGINVSAQESNVNSTPLEISGSVDTYWKYDFAKTANIPTYFDSDQNSISLGMIDVALKKSTGKASFVGELSFGPRGQYQSLVTGDSNDGSNSFHIQNLYASYSFTDKLSMTAGFMGTFIGYEVISPASNFHYSTSYLFGAGPFQNAGIKANYEISDKISVMAGLFNDWNVYQDLNGVSHFGAQISLTPIKGLSAYLNFLTGSSVPDGTVGDGSANNGTNDAYSSGTIYDLVASYEFSDKFSLGLNAADYSFKGEGGYSGVALYSKVNISNSFGLGLRGEYFKNKNISSFEGESVTSFTLSANLKHGGLTFIPEIRLDNSKNDTFGFVKENGLATKSASQFSLALVYVF